MHVGQRWEISGAAPVSSWQQQAADKLTAMERLIAQGKGDTIVDGGGCTEPGGGIVPTRHTAREMAAMMRQILGQQQTTGASPPTSPPPFGRPAGHIGGTYDWWWWNFGRRSGMKYNPPQTTGAMTSQERAVVPFAVPLGVGLVARLLGASWPAAIVIGAVAIPIVWFLGYQATWSAPATPQQ